MNEGIDDYLNTLSQRSVLLYEIAALRSQ